jgi:hypothetical protein
MLSLATFTRLLIIHLILDRIRKIICKLYVVIVVGGLGWCDVAKFKVAEFSKAY